VRGKRGDMMIGSARQKGVYSILRLFAERERTRRERGERKETHLPSRINPRRFRLIKSRPTFILIESND